MNIGADELILWLRKNGKAVNIRNNDLGKRIHDVICNKCGGHELPGNIAVYWDVKDGNYHIGDYDLPKTAVQYEISENQLGNLFTIINLW